MAKKISLAEFIENNKALCAWNANPRGLALVEKTKKIEIGETGCGISCGKVKVYDCGETIFETEWNRILADLDQNKTPALVFFAPGTVRKFREEHERISDRTVLVLTEPTAAAVPLASRWRKMKNLFRGKREEAAK